MKRIHIVPKRLVSLGETLAKKRLQALQKAKDKKTARIAHKRQLEEALTSAEDN